MTEEKGMPTTAYSAKQARLYDITRFTSKAGRVIHNVELSKLLSVLLELPKDSRVLEVGVGTGRLLTECLAAGYKVDGVDASKNMLAELTQKLQIRGVSLELEVGEAGYLPYEDNIYDFVYSIRVLNQTASADYALRSVSEMLRVAKSGGRVLVEAVNDRRPRVSRNNAETVRLRSEDIQTEAENSGASVNRLDGAFFFGMGALDLLGDRLSPVVSAVDRLFCKVFPNYCARIYLLLDKK
jgi:ubiquinone/menaquinone biosynthesis C-methylase UbiE